MTADIQQHPHFVSANICHWFAMNLRGEPHLTPTTGQPGYYPNTMLAHYLYNRWCLLLTIDVGASRSRRLWLRFVIIERFTFPASRPLVFIFNAEEPSNRCRETSFGANSFEFYNYVVRGPDWKKEMGLKTESSYNYFKSLTFTNSLRLTPICLQTLVLTGQFLVDTSSFPIETSEPSLPSL